MSGYYEEITKLATSVHQHGALNNAFYERWLAAPLSFDELALFAKNYLVRTSQTSTMLALSLVHTDNLCARVEIAKNLYSEYGYGQPQKAHIHLLENFLTDLLSRVAVAYTPVTKLSDDLILPSTRQFVAEQQALYTRTPEKSGCQRALGALLAQEWLAFSTLTRLYEGVRHYQDLYASNDEFHEHCEYFYVHIGNAEKEHKIQAIHTATLECHDDDEFAALADGFYDFMTLTEQYWNGIAHAMGYRPSQEQAPSTLSI